MKIDQLRQYQNRLLEMRDRLSGEVNSLVEAVVADANPLGEHDRGVSESVDKESSLTTAEQRLRQEVIEALGRIDAGKYGRCEACGKPIDETRLNALPQTPLCLPCERARESAR